MSGEGAVVLVEYNAEWPKRFDEERSVLLDAFDGIAEVEHIGSTAVPGLVAKPIVDILLGAPSLEAIESRIARLAVIGYQYVADYERELPNRRYFVKPSQRGAGLHLHAVRRSDPFWSAHVAFRDMLREDPRLAAEYAALKRSLAARFSGDRGAYTDGKSPFIRSALRSKCPASAS